jgi:glycerol kinase
MVVNNTLMQFQADILGVPVIRPKIAETTALGAAYAAGLATGFWSSLDELRENWGVAQTWEPTLNEDDRARLYRQWKRAVERSFGWIEDED